MAKSKNTGSERIEVKAPNFKIAEFEIVGSAPYVQNKFSARAAQAIHVQQEAGSTAKKGKKREPKDFQRSFQEAIHRSPDGWCGIPATAFRRALISACRTVGFQMTKAKLSLFVLADGHDKDDESPLVKILKGEPEYFESTVRLPDGTLDLRARPKWAPGWEARVRIRFDADMFTLQDVANLLCRAGIQVGVGEGRPDSSNSSGMGWGTFDIKGDANEVC